MDSGNIADLPGKLDVIMSVMSQLKYAAVGLGNADVRIGGEFFSKAKANKLTVLDASPGADQSTIPYVIKDVDGVKVGIISFGVAPPEAKVDELQLRKVRFAAYRQVRSRCDVLILLDQANAATSEWLDSNVTRLGGAPDIVIGGPERQSMTVEKVVGKTHVMPSLYQAKELGVIDVEVMPGQALSIKARRIMLDDKFAEDQQIAKRVGEGIVALGKSVPRTSPSGDQASTKPKVRDADAKPYQSPRLCKKCHEKQYDDWAQTKHAKALDTLVAGKNMTPDCLPCHSELYRTKGSGMVLNKLAGVECATCHMNALPHGAERKDVAERSKVDPKLCLECHTKERSPTYNVKTYFPQIVHSGKAATTAAANPRPAK